MLNRLKMTTEVKPAVVVTGTDGNGRVNSTSASPITVPEGFLEKPALDADDGISSEEEEEDEEEGDDEEEEEPVKTSAPPSRRTSSATTTSQSSEVIGARSRRTSSEASTTSESSEGSKEKVAAVKKEPTSVVESEKKVEENETNDKKPIKKEPTNLILNSQIKLEKVSIVKVKKEPSAKDDGEEKNENSGSDSGVDVESSSGDSKDIKIIPPPKIGSLTVLGPSRLCSVGNGALSITPANALDSPLNALSAMAGNSNSESAAGGFGGGGDAQLSSEYIPLDKLAMMGTRTRYSSDGGGGVGCEVCGETAVDAAALEAHRVARKHYKCCVAPECAAVVFETRHDLNMHKMGFHGMLQPTPPPSPLASSQSTTQLFCGPVTPPQPQPGSIQPRSFASLAAPASQQNTDLLNTVNTNQLLVMKRLQTQAAATDAPLAKARRMDVGLDNVMPMQGAASPVQLRPGSSVLISASPQKGGADVVANLLATRGITVTPSGDANRLQPPQQQAAPSRPPPPAVPLTISSAISILPASKQTRQGFASPQAGGSRSGRAANQPSTVNLPTVDLTRDTPQRQQLQQRQQPQLQQRQQPQLQQRGRPMRARPFTCQVCDKTFHTREGLSTHMSTHRSSGKPASLSTHMSTHASPDKSSSHQYRCNMCKFTYTTAQGLAHHKKSFHKEGGSSPDCIEMALPVCDLKQPGVPERLASLGVRHCIMLSQLQSMSGGMFGIPIIAIGNARSPATSNLGGLGASNILSLGPLKPLD